MISIRTMTPADIPLGMRLKDAAGWNQIEADWHRHLKLEPQGCFVASIDGTPAATLAVTVFDCDASPPDAPLQASPPPSSSPTAWIAMVLTDPAFRRRGLAAALLDHAVKYCDGRGVGEIRLDATEMGRPVYEKLGFSTIFDLTRWRGVARTATPTEAIGLRPMTGQDLADGELADLDRLATGEDRRRLLSALRDELPECALTAANDPRELTAVLGFALARRGCRARQIGPVIARTDLLGGGLLRAALTHARSEEVVVDVPNFNDAATAVVREVELKPERAFHRMLRRSSPCEVALETASPALWVSAGPEFG